MKNPQAFTLSVDLFGPMPPIEKGRDEQSISGNAHLRFGLVGVFRMPKSMIAAKFSPPATAPQPEEEDDDPFRELPGSPGEYAPTEASDDQDALPLQEVDEIFQDHDQLPKERALDVVDGLPSEVDADDAVIPVPDEEYGWLDDDKLEAELKDATSKVELVTLRFFVGLKSKTGADVTAGIQQIILRITQKYPLRILHCDPGTEFASDMLARWLPGQGVRLQTTIPTDKQGNGLAERVVGWFKARARTLLAANKMPACYWPLAMRWASESFNRAALGQEPIPAFGQPVLHKLKRPAGAHKELLTRWVKASCGAIPEGHVLVTSEGNLVASKGFRTGVIDPTTLDDVIPPPIQEEDAEGTLLEEEVLGAPAKSPDKRLREKTTVRFVEGQVEPRSPELLAKQCLKEGNFSDDKFREIAATLEGTESSTSDRRGDFEGRFVLGANCHGGQRGLTTLSKQHPYLTKFLNEFLRRKAQDSCRSPEWASLLLMHTSDVPMHRDFRNEWDTHNFALCVPGTIELWKGPLHNPKVGLESVSPCWNSTDVVNLVNKVQSSDPRRYHAVRRNPDWVIVGYTPLGTHKLGTAERNLLHDLGFNPPVRDQEEHQIKAFRAHRDSEARSSTQPARADSVQGPLSADEQPDSHTQLVSWDLSEGATRNQPTGETLPRELQVFLWERDIEYMLPELQRLGVEEPEDLIYLYEEDLLEFGMSRAQAARVLFGVHPPGTRRPDNPNNSGLKTGEVRLFDREGQQIPWVFQNRTLAQSSPGPPLPNLGVRTEGIEQSSGSSRPWHEPTPLVEEPVDPYLDEVLTAESPEWGPPPWDIPVNTSLMRPHPVEAELTPEPAAHCWEDEWTPSNMPAGYSRGLWQDSWNNTVAAGADDPWDDPWVTHTTAASSDDHFESGPPEVTPTIVEQGAASQPQSAEPDSPHDSSPSVCVVQVEPSEAVGMQPRRGIGPQACRVTPTEVFRNFQESSQLRVHFPSVVKVDLDEETGFTQQPCVTKVVENSFTPNIEEVLSSLDGPLEVVHQVSPAEVKANLDKWRNSAQEELNSLEGMQAIVRHRGAAARRLAQDPNIEVIPAKCVFTVKPGKPYRRKVRIVSCGNYAKSVSEDILYASGAAAETLRIILVRSGFLRHSAWATDIKNAFLLAPIPDGNTKRYALRPPAILVLLGIVHPDEVWEVCRALYGFKEAPKWWAGFRDNVLSTAVFETPSGHASLQRTVSDENLWRITLSDGTVLGHVLVYVDDLLILSTSQVARALHDWIKERWQCSELERAQQQKPLRFLGIDIYEVQDEYGAHGFSLGQEGYIDELIRSHNLSPTCRSAVPVPKEWVREAPPEEVDYPESVLREAQRITGELLWLSQRTRIDVAFAVGLMSSWASKAPAYVSKVGLRILAYLANTKHLRLSLAADESFGLEVFTDASFAPFGERSISGITVQLGNRCVFWKSRRQTLVSLSTAECELIAACEGVVLAQSVQALANELLGEDMGITLRVDNVAAIILAGGGGSQRTRHLRVRANFLKEMIENNKLQVRHCPGEGQLADALTKALPAPRLEYLNQLLGVLAPSPEIPSVQALTAASSTFRNFDVASEGQGMILVMALLMLQLQPAASQDEDEQDPLDLDLYVVAMMMACSVLFVWEVGKHCLRQCLSEPEARVAALRQTEEETRKTRALEREDGDELRHRRDSLIAGACPCLYASSTQPH